MLVELRDVEVHVEPEEILTQALRDGDLYLSHAITLCIEEEDADAVLEAVENKDIRDYCDKHSIYRDKVDFEFLMNAIQVLSEQQKADLVWKLLKIF